LTFSAVPGRFSKSLPKDLFVKLCLGAWIVPPRLFCYFTEFI